MSNKSRYAAGEEPGAPVAGGRLVEARRLRQISLKDIARELHLDEAKVQALEENRFDVLGAPVFAKGYLRKYAALVGASIDDIMADYYKLTRAGGGAPAIRPRPPVKPARPVARWLLLALTPVLLVAAMYWWLGRDLETPEQAAPAVTGTAPVTESAPAQGTDALEEAASRPPETAEPAAAAAEDVAPSATRPADVAAPAPAPSAEKTAPERPVPPPAPVGEVRLELAFTGDCWTEVTDASGRRLFFDLGRAGQAVRLSGRAPLRVLLGDADNVALTVNGEPYPLAAAERRGETASLTIRRP